MHWKFDRSGAGTFFGLYNPSLVAPSQYEPPPIEDTLRYLDKALSTLDAALHGHIKLGETLYLYLAPTKSVHSETYELERWFIRAITRQHFYGAHKHLSVTEFCRVGFPESQAERCQTVIVLKPKVGGPSTWAHLHV